MNFFKSLSKKVLILIFLGVFAVAGVIVNGVFNVFEKSMQATLTTTMAKHKKEIAQLKAKHKKEIAKVKAKERSKRSLAAIPIVGSIAALWTGKEVQDDYKEWKIDNPEGTPKEYAQEQVELVTEP